MTTTTRRLLACGVVGGPLFAVVALAQALTRPGFDLTRQAVSMLSLGGDGWIQIANFLVAGFLALACATGVRRALRGRPGGTWAPRLLCAYGAGLIAGGLFHPDAGSGFPPGTPTGQSVVRSWHGALHMTFGMLAFIALIVACFVLARYYRSCGRRQWATASRFVGAVFAACVLGSAAPGGSLTLFVGATTAMVWIAIIARQLTSADAAAEVVRPRLGAQPQPVKQLS